MTIHTQDDLDNPLPVYSEKDEPISFRGVMAVTAAGLLFALVAVVALFVIALLVFSALTRDADAHAPNLNGDGAVSVVTAEVRPRPGILQHPGGAGLCGNG